MTDLAVRDFDASSVPLVAHGLGATRRVVNPLDERGLRRALIVSTQSLLGTNALGALQEALGNQTAGEPKSRRCAWPAPIRR